MRTAKTLIRLGGCPGWSESSLGIHAISLVLSRCGSFQTVHLGEAFTLWSWNFTVVLFHPLPNVASIFYTYHLSSGVSAISVVWGYRLAVMPQCCKRQIWIRTASLTAFDNERCLFLFDIIDSYWTFRRFWLDNVPQQFNWPKDVNPPVLFHRSSHICFTITYYWVKIFAQYLFSKCTRFHFCWFIFFWGPHIWVKVLFCSLSFL